MNCSSAGFHDRIASMAATDCEVVACASRFTVTMLPTGANCACGDSGRSTCPKIISNAARMGIWRSLVLPGPRAIRPAGHGSYQGLRDPASRARESTPPSRDDTAPRGAAIPSCNGVAAFVDELVILHTRGFTSSLHRPHTRGNPWTAGAARDKSSRSRAWNGSTPGSLDTPARAQGARVVPQRGSAKMRKGVFVVRVAAAVLLGAMSVVAQVNVGSLADDGWYSDDTRADGSGTQP